VAFDLHVESKLADVKGLTGMKSVLNRSDWQIAVLDLEA
jgi:hypothetical protein